MEFITTVFTDLWSWLTTTNCPILDIPFSALFLGIISIKFVIMGFNIIIGKNSEDKGD